jgi:hypothetical protein
MHLAFNIKVEPINKGLAAQAGIENILIDPPMPVLESGVWEELIRASLAAPNPPLTKNDVFNTIGARQWRKNLLIAVEQLWHWRRVDAQQIINLERKKWEGNCYAGAGFGAGW